MGTTLFSMDNVQADYTHRVRSNLNLHITRMTNNVVLLYLTDDLSNRVPMPSELQVYTYETTNEYEPAQRVLVVPNEQGCALSWTNDYDIYLDGNDILRIQANRSWTISHRYPWGFMSLFSK